MVFKNILGVAENILDDIRYLCSRIQDLSFCFGLWKINKSKTKTAVIRVEILKWHFIINIVSRERTG